MAGSRISSGTRQGQMDRWVAEATRRCSRPLYCVQAVTSSWNARPSHPHLPPLSTVPRPALPSPPPLPSPLPLLRSPVAQLLGVVENMSFFRCPCCGHRSDIFHSGGAKALAHSLGLPCLAEVSASSCM